MEVDLTDAERQRIIEVLGEVNNSKLIIINWKGIDKRILNKIRFD